MSSYGAVILILAFSALAGCAAYQAEPLDVNHPAHPEATASPTRPGSTTLAYTSTDIPSQRQIAAGEQRQHEGHHEAQAGTQQTVTGEGTIVATVPNASQLVVEHGEIKGFMDAMTMGYQVDPPSLLAGLKAGDRVRLTIDVQKKTIVKIEKLNK